MLPETAISSTTEISESDPSVSAVQEPESVTSVTTNPDAAPKPSPHLRYPTMADFEGMSEVEIDITLGVYARMHQAREDEKIRQDPWVRVYTTRLIRDLQYLIQETAGEMICRRAKAEGTLNRSLTGYFASDEAAEVLLWQMTEYITQALLPRDDECYQANAKFLQLDLDRAGSHFEITEKGGYLRPEGDYGDVTPADENEMGDLLRLRI